MLIAAPPLSRPNKRAQHERRAQSPNATKASWLTADKRGQEQEPWADGRCEQAARRASPCPRARRGPAPAARSVPTVRLSSGLWLCQTAEKRSMGDSNRGSVRGLSRTQVTHTRLADNRARVTTRRRCGVRDTSVRRASRRLSSAAGTRAGGKTANHTHWDAALIPRLSEPPASPWESAELPRSLEEFGRVPRVGSASPPQSDLAERED